jgi:hypothetical protein
MALKLRGVPVKDHRYHLQLRFMSATPRMQLFSPCESRQIC